MGPLDDPMADDFFIPNPPLTVVYMTVVLMFYLISVLIVIVN